MCVNISIKFPNMFEIMFKDYKNFLPVFPTS